MSAPRPLTRPEARRTRFVPATLGVVVGMLLAGVVVPFVVGDRGEQTAATSGGLVRAAAGSSRDGDAESTGSAASVVGGPAGTTPGSAAGVAGASGRSAATAPNAATDTTPVKVGFTLFDVGGASNIGFAIAVDPKVERQVYQAYVDYLNGTGGINGRKIDPVFSTYDLLNQDSQNASCLALTQDAKVFAVIGGYNFTSADECVVQQNKTLMLNNNSFTTEELYQSGRHVSIYARANRMMAVFARRMAETGQLRGKKVGILDDLGADPNRSVLNALSAEVKANGGNVVRESVLSADLPTGSSQIPVEVSQMHAAGVDTVLLIAFGLFGTQFVQQADSQQWTPAYGAADWQAWYSNVAVSNMPASFAGAYSITSVRTSEERVGIPEPPQAGRCRQIFEQMSKTKLAPRGDDSYGLTMQACDTLLVFAAAARAAGPTLSPGSFVAGIQRVGTVDSAAWGGGAFGPGKLDLNDQTRINRWSADCKCWKPTTPFSGA